MQPFLASSRTSPELICRRVCLTPSTDLVVALYKLALGTEGDTKRANVDEALKIVEWLDAEGKLAPDKKNWKSMLLALRGEPQPQ